MKIFEYVLKNMEKKVPLLQLKYNATKKLNAPIFDGLQYLIKKKNMLQWLLVDRTILLTHNNVLMVSYR